VIVPTVASTDAPTSALSVIYKENGEHSHEVFQQQNPNIIIVDSAVIAKAPVRLLVSGMGDALSTYFEASANDASNSDNVVALEMNLSIGPSLAAKELAHLCHEVLIRDGRKAKISAEMGIVTPALENVIEANTLLSGIGFESNGTAAAHAIGDGITAVPTESVYYHGERVAFGVLCELILTNASDNLLDEIYKFCVDVGLPVTLNQLGITEITEDILNTIANVADHNVIHAEHRIVTSELIKSAIRTADVIGRDYLLGKHTLGS
jgi:glycerol dehydrogenase